MGLFTAPAERHMGEVSRIFYVHVPSAMVDLLTYTIAFGFAVISLWTSGRRWDALTTGALETGVVLNIVMLGTGMLFARPTWGIWWSWDVRLTTSLLALVLFGGVLALRSVVDDPDRRAVWTAVSTIIAYVDVPLIYFCVRWWRSLHQVQSSPDTVDSAMVLPFRINAVGILLLVLWFIAVRSRIELLRRDNDETPEPDILPAAVAAT
jgi:heme exporter protein C